jgi:hypothetical protein
MMRLTVILDTPVMADFIDCAVLTNDVDNPRFLDSHNLL